MDLSKCTIKSVENIRIGDTICFTNPRQNYTVDDIKLDRIGTIRLYHNYASESYWPSDLLYVLSAQDRAITEYYTDRNESGQAALTAHK